MVNTNMLRGKIVERGKSVAVVAHEIGVDKSTLYRKITAGDLITIGDADKIADALSLSKEEATAIFFSQYSRI